LLFSQTEVSATSLKQTKLKKGHAMDERRGTPRYEVVLKVRYESEQEFQDAVIHNLSSGGVYLSTPNPFPIGSEFLLNIELPDTDEWISGKCKVVWINEIDTEQYPRGMGVAFLETPPQYNALLKRTISHSDKR
jgi:uncharacterized protein (TIGR02266 family)